MEYNFKTEPMAHQLAAWRESRDREFFALFMEMGTGKTKVLIDTASWLYDNGKITGVLVVCPKSIVRNWTDDEIPKHMAEHVNYRVAYWDAALGKAQRERVEKFLGEVTDDLRIFVVNVEALTTADGLRVVKSFLLGSKALFAIDESTIIKSPRARRTKEVLRLAPLAKYRRILTGNPYPNSPLDVYSQCQFLSPHCLGFSSFVAFRSRFADTVPMKLHANNRKYVIQRVTGYKDLEELRKLVAPFSFVVRSDDCLDIPDKVYLPPRRFDMTPKQKKAYDEMKKYAMTEIGQQLEMSFVAEPGQEASGVSPDRTFAVAEIVLTKLLRMQQISCGFVTSETGDLIDLCGDENPRIETMLEICEERDGKVIIWAPFTAAIDQIIAALSKKFGPERVVRFDGKVTSGDELQEAKRLFQDPDSEVEFFVTSQAKGSRGITLTQARLMLYYSNTYDADHREQSEKRAHRIGLEHVVNYLDIRANGSNDDKVAEVLSGKKSVADMLRDGSWKQLFE